MNKLEKTLLTKIKKSPDFDFQGFKIRAYQDSQKILDLSAGKTFPYYDLASLTKVIFTTTWFMEQYQQNKSILNTSVLSILPWYKYGNVTVGKLLNHSAGNDWWKPFYLSLSKDLSPEQSYQQMEKVCQGAPISKGGQAVYSDIDFYLLGSIMQKIERKPLVQIWQRVRETYFEKTQLHFNYKNKSVQLKTQYAPAEKCPWRKKILRGEVHDENAWALGGVAPHAGLFGRIEDLAAYGLMLDKIRFGKYKLISKQTLKKFSERSMKKEKGDWGLGFMVPSTKGSSAGELFSKKSFGHTGFTGTSFWLDPTRDLFVCILSNRVYLSRKNKGFQRLRPKLHDWIVKELEGQE